MPPRPRRTMVRSMGRSRRRTAWATFTQALTFTANTQNFPVDLLSGYKAITGMSTVGVTVGRVLLSVTPRAPAAADRFWIGLLISDVADLTNAVTVSPLQPDPQTTPYLDWMWNRQYTADQNEAFFEPGRGGVDLDVRAKRKMHQLQQSLGLIVRQEAVGTVAKTYDVWARTLLLLP